MHMSSRSVTRRLLCGSAALSGVLAVLAGPAPASAAPVPERCAWRFQSDGELLDVAFPDTNAAYWVLPYALGTSDTIQVSGTFPSARYFSLSTYGTDLDTIDTLRDEHIEPDADRTDTGALRWSATLVPGAADPARNQIQALRPGEPPIGFLILRVYVPDDPASLTGGVPLPDVRYRLGSTTVPVPPCDRPFAPGNYDGPVADAARAGIERTVGAAASDTVLGSSPEAMFVNPARTSGLFPNGDNKYIAARFTYAPGRAVVVRGRAPTFPDTRAGVPATEAGRQLRYWSMCQNDLVLPYPVVACAADFRTAVDADGYYTYIVAPPDDLPDDLPEAVTVLPWGSIEVATKLLILRNMLPSSEFRPSSIQASQAAGTEPAVTMGDYYPTATYCPVSTLEGPGYRACFENPRP